MRGETLPPGAARVTYGLRVSVETRLEGAPRWYLRWGTFLRQEAAVSAVLGTIALIGWGLSGGGYFWPAWQWFGLGLLLALQAAVRRGLREGPGRRTLAVHGWVSGVLALALVVIWALSGTGAFWPAWPCLGLGLLLGCHMAVKARVGTGRERELASRVDVLTRTRSSAIDVQAAELRRIERDLHDGTQARLVSVAMSLGLAEELLARDPESLAGLLAEARTATLSALDDLRTLMKGIQPPVLADRGLEGAVRALALDLAVPATVRGAVPGRVPAPVESAAYFAIAECLANVVKHSNAQRASVELAVNDGILSAVVHDDGVGGASLDGGTGLRGVARRLEVFDGTVAVHSPAGGPTTVRMEVPCAPSSPRT